MQQSPVIRRLPPILRRQLSPLRSLFSVLRPVLCQLSSVTAGFSLRSLPSSKDIISTLRFLLSRLEFPIPLSDKALEEELMTFLRLLNCPCKLARSSLKAPGAPHAWPPVLSVLFWLAQFASVHDHSSELAPSDPPADLDSYLYPCYKLFLSGDDDTVDVFDDEYAEKVRDNTATSTEYIEGLQKEVMDLEARLSAMTQGPSAREEFETKRALLMEDWRKFETVMQNWTGWVREMEETLAGLQRELEEKETKRYMEERSELEKRIREQGVNVRDTERMRREMQSVERDVEEAINGKNLMEERSWEFEAGIAKKLDELELLVEQCNNVFRK